MKESATSKQNSRRFQSDGAAYLSQVSKYKTLSRDEQFDLIKDWNETGNQKSFDLVFKSNLKLVPWVARKFVGIDDYHFMDLVQEGNIALFESLRAYNTDKFTNSVTRFAMRFVKTHMIRFRMRFQRTIRVTPNSSTKAIIKALSGSDRELSYEQMEEIAKENGLSVYNLIEAYNQLRPDMSTNQSRSVDVLADPSDMEKSHFVSELSKNVRDCLSSLNSEKHEQVVKEYLFEGKTFEQIAKKQNKTRQWANLVFLRAMKRVKKKMEVKNVV